MKKTKLTRSLLAAVSIVALSAVMYGCTHDGDDPVVMEDPPEPTPFERATDAIAAATTAEAAQAAYDAVKDEVTAAQGEMLQMAVDERIAEIETAASAEAQEMALMDAADMIDTSDEALSTQEGVDAARTAISGLRQAIADAGDVDDTSMYQSQLDAAVAAVDAAQGGIDTDTRRTNQMEALSGASDDLQAALAALSGSTPTQAQLDAANNALSALNTAIAGGADLTDDEKAPYQHEAANAAAPIRTAQMAFDDAGDEAEKAANEAMAATAAKLYANISAPAAAGDVIRSAAYGADANADDIVVTIGTTTANLSEDKKAMVADHHGWTGMRYTHTVPSTAATGAGDTYEAMVYSNVGEPTMGPKFNSGAGVGNVGFALDGTTGETPSLSTLTGYAALVDSPSFDQTAGAKAFKLPDNAVRVMIPGTYHGVSGTYYCTVPTGGSCTATIAEEGFTLAGVDADGNSASATWTFKPTDPEARVMSVDDAIYASYGWWIRKSADDSTYTASAFAAVKGAVEAADGITALRGTATYVGGAAGKYALSSTTGGTNDAGHFTARATLEADFVDDMITGTIDNFMGADGMSRNWSVTLNETDIGNTGTIDGLSGSGNDEQVGTVWTIDGTAGEAVGQWSGTLYDNDEGGVPQVATGTFYSEFGRDGKIVGAFGAKEQ